MLRLAVDTIEWRQVDGEVVVLNTQSSKYLALTGSAVDLWPLLLEDTDRPALVATLVQTYGIDERLASADVSAFLDDLERHGIVKPATSEPTP